MVQATPAVMGLGPTTGPGPLNDSVLVPAFRVQALGAAVPPLTRSTSFRVGVVAARRTAVGLAIALPTPRSAMRATVPTVCRARVPRDALWASFE
jgi:hypothetical protein